MTEVVDNKNKKSKLYLFIIVLALALINMLLIYKIMSSSKQLKQTETELVDTREDLAELEAIKAEMDEELSMYKGQNAYLDSIIKLKEEEIKIKTAKIENMLKAGKITKQQRDKALAEIEELKKMMAQQAETIDHLNDSIIALNEANYLLDAQLQSSNERIGEMEGTLAERDKQVAIGKRLFLKSLEVTPLRTALFGGEYKATDKLARLEYIRINFTLANNDLADKGEKTLYFKIQTPNKSTLVDESLGAGTFNFQGGESMYTVKKVVNFQNKNESGEIMIPKSSGLTIGEYIVHVYSDSHLMTSTKFVLR